MSADTVCRVCLVNNLNLYGVQNELQVVYERITRQKYNKVGYPVSMCYICLSGLRKCHRFMETAQDADRSLTQWYKHQNEMEVFKPLSTYSITKATLVSVGNANISLTHDFKIENVDLAEQSVYDVKIENKECIDAADTENLDIDKPTDYGSTMLVDGSTVTKYNYSRQVSDDKQTVSLFSTNMDSRLDMVTQHNNDNSQISYITEVKSEIETKDVIQLISAHEIPKDLHTEIEIDETDDGDADDVCHTENFNMKFNPQSKNTQNGNILNISDVYDKSAGLKLHGILKHSTTKILKKLNKNNTWTWHMRTHTGEKSFSCDICDYKCTRKSNLKRHILSHTGEKSFACDVCDSKFTLKATLTKHIRIHTGEKPFSCDICDYKCSRKTSLTQHIRTHTGERPFSCDICDYKCTQKSNLNRHITNHIGGKPFSCDLCDYKCKRKSSLTLHIKTHTGAKPFSCNICDYKCTYKSNLTRHIRIHTG